MTSIVIQGVNKLEGVIRERNYKTVKFTICFHISNALVVHTTIINIQTIMCPRQKRARPGAPLFNHYTHAYEKMNNLDCPFGSSLDVFQRKRSTLS